MQKKFWNTFFKLFAKGENQNNSTSIDLPTKLIEILGFVPKNKILYIEALTPRSAHQLNSDGESFNYERLEFLGDAMLGAVISDYLFNEAPHENEGYLTKMRSKIVSRKHLNEIGKNLGLIGFISPEIKKGITLSNNVPGDMFESLVGAVYEDQGFEVTRKFINKVVISPYVDLMKLESRVTSYKSLVLEWSQKNKKHVVFKTEKEKNAEEQLIFVSKLFVNNKEVAKGRGSSKKRAEEKAAKRTFFAFQDQIETVDK